MRSIVAVTPPILVFALWAVLISAAEDRGALYSRALLDEVAGDLEREQGR